MDDSGDDDNNTVLVLLAALLVISLFGLIISVILNVYFVVQRKKASIRYSA